METIELQNNPELRKVDTRQLEHIISKSLPFGTRRRVFETSSNQPDHSERVRNLVVTYKTIVGSVLAELVIRKIGMPDSEIKIELEERYLPGFIQNLQRRDSTLYSIIARHYPSIQRMPVYNK